LQSAFSNTREQFSCCLVKETFFFTKYNKYGQINEDEMVEARSASEATKRVQDFGWKA
jgi:hypothetical protein